MTIDFDFLSDEVLTAAGLRMPFGKFKGTRLIDLPEPYVVWFKQQGFPKGRLGQQMAVVYEIKANGLEKLIRPLLVTEADHETTHETPHEAAPDADESSQTNAPTHSDDKAP